MKLAIGSMIMIPALGFCLGADLKPGTEWTFRVWRSAESDSTRTSLRLLDSTRTPAGLEWKVAIRDSLLEGQRRIRMDTAILLVTDTSTVWSYPSCLAAFDPKPHPPASPVFLPAIRDSINPWSIVWGSVATGCRDPLPPRESGFRPELAGSFTYLTRDFRRGWIASATRAARLRSFALDTNLWRWFQSETLAYSGPSQTTGGSVEPNRRSDDPIWGMLRLEDPVTGETWLLETKNGAAVPEDLKPKGRLALHPKVGDEMAWRYTFGFSNLALGARKSDTGEVRWRMRERLPDSAQWVRWEVEQSFCPDHKECAMSVGKVALLPEQYLSKVDPPLLPEPARGMMLDWAAPGIAWVDNGNWFGPTYLSYRDEYFRATPGVGLDSSYVWSQGMLGASSANIWRKRAVSGLEKSPGQGGGIESWRIQDLVNALRKGSRVTILEPNGRRRLLDRNTLDAILGSSRGVVLCDILEAGVARRGLVLLLR